MLCLAKVSCLSVANYNSALPENMMGAVFHAKALKFIIPLRKKFARLPVTA